jgi:hypothetical protein
MAPTKSIPYSSSKVRETTGITFSFRLTPKGPDQCITFESNDEESPRMAKSCYYLEPSVHTISSLHLFRRLNRQNKKEAKKTIKPVKPSMGRKRKGTTTTSIAGECVWCGTHKTAQWRKVSQTINYKGSYWRKKFV